MKKIFETLVALLLTVSCALAQTPARAQDAHAGELAVLQALGLFAPGAAADALSKADAAKALARLICPDDITAAKNDPAFADVHDNIAGADAINLLAAMGYIKAGGYYNPLLDASVRDVAEILCGIIGYGWLEEDCLRRASAMGMLRGVNASESGAVTYGQMAKMVYNILDEPFLVRAVSGKAEIDAERTLLSVNGIVRGAGALVASENGALAGYDSAKNTLLFADKTGGLIALSTSAAAGYDRYLGGGATYYYREQKSGDNLLLHADVSQIRWLSIDADDITSVTDDAVVYLSGNNEKTARLTDGAPVIYNGKMTPRKDRRLYIQPQNGTVFLIEGAGGKSYVSAYVQDYTPCLAETVYYAENAIRLKASALSGERVLRLDDYTEVELAKNGKPVQIDDIYAYDVLSVRESADKTKLSINAYNDRSVWGRITEKSEDFAVIAEKEYPIFDGVLNYGGYGAPLTMSDTATYYYDEKGKIFLFLPDAIMEQNMYGYILGFQAKEKLKDEMKIKLMNELGQIKTFDFADRIAFAAGDGGKAGSIGKEDLIGNPSFYSGGAVVRQLIYYSLNSSGKLCALKLAEDISQSGSDYKTGEFTLVMKNPLPDGNNIRFDRNGAGKFEDKYCAKSGAIVFVIDEEDESYSHIATVAEAFPNLNDNARTSGKLSVYNADEYLRVSMAVLVRSSANAASSTQDEPVVVDYIATAANADGGVASVIYGYKKGAPVRYVAADNADGLSSLTRGSMMQATFNKFGEISGVRALYGKNDADSLVRSYSFNGSSAEGESASWSNTFLVFRGKALAFSPDQSVLVINSGGDWDQDRAISVSGCSFYTYDRARGKLSAATAASLAPTRDEPVEVLIGARASVVKAVVVYQ